MNNDFIEIWKTMNKQGYQKYVGTAELLQSNSKELVSVCNDFDILKDGIDIFEIGCGCGRNLFYMWESNNNVKISGNDLIREECFKYMKEEIKSIIDFKEIDTLRLVEENKLSVDLFISSDHLMHLEPSDVQKVLREVVDKWKPNYILLRESRVDRLNHGVKKYTVDWSFIKTKYDIVYEEIIPAYEPFDLVLAKIK